MNEQDCVKEFSPQPLPPWRRAVLKVGSSLLSGFDDAPGLDARHARALAAFVAQMLHQGREMVLVSSGAVAAGRARVLARGSGLLRRQALAALGQAQLTGFWQSLLAVPVAQVLLTHDDLRDRRRYLNARATLRELMELRVLPVVNENDTVAVDELKVGDNDNLAAAVAAVADADILLIASDVGGLYSADPGVSIDARAISVAGEVSPELLEAAGGAGRIGTGGMRTKLEAAAKAAHGGIPTALFCGRDARIMQALADGTLHGTLIAARPEALPARKQWLQHAPAIGHLDIDPGAAEALRSRGASLLPGGLCVVHGSFRRGDLVEVRSVGKPHALARGLVQYSAGELRRIAGRRGREIESILGFHFGEVVIHRDDLVLLDGRSLT